MLCAHVAARVPGNSVAGKDDRGDVGVVPESPSRVDATGLAEANMVYYGRS